MDDTTSLDRLHPVVLPDAVGWLPLAPGWKVVLVFVALALLVFAWRRWLAWRDDRYRRQALKELRHLADTGALPRLLRRAALSAWPRERVAPLEGEAWHRFLDETAGFQRFAGTGACGVLLDRAAYGGPALNPDEGETLRVAIHDWLRGHRRPA